MSAPLSVSLLRSDVLPVALVAALLAGCSKGPELCQVIGVVTLDGKPVAGAGILYSPTGTGGLPASATTDANGKYQLMTNKLPGATPGEHVVLISKAQISGVAADANQLETPGSPRAAQAVSQIPEKYGKRETALNVTVERQPKDHAYDFDLSSK